MMRWRAHVALGVAGGIVVAANITLLAIVMPQLTAATTFPITYTTGLTIGFAMLITAIVLQQRERIDQLHRRLQKLEEEDENDI
jgi:TRAP-type C4-dicarboxylate transport system permease small subunit